MSDGNEGPVSLPGARARLMPNRMVLILFLIILCMGIFAIVTIKKQKQPAVDLSYSSISIAFPGATVEEVEQLVATPAEQILSEVEGLEHIFSTSRPGLATITVQYRPGTDKTEAMVRLYDVMFSSQDWLPVNIGIESPVIRSIGIDDIPMMTLTLWSDNQRTGAFELQQVAHSLEAELMRIQGVRQIETVGGAERVIRIIIDPIKAAAFSISVNEIANSLGQANTSYNAGELVRDNQTFPVQAGGFLSSTTELENLVVNIVDESPVYLSDVATIIDGPDIPTSYVTHFSPNNNQVEKQDLVSSYPAVTMMITYKAGANDVLVADRLMKHLHGLKGRFIPDEVNVEITRNYSRTAHDKIHVALFKIVLVLLLLGLLVAWYSGKTGSIAVIVSVVAALMLTIFSARVYGLAISHISFSIVILLVGLFVIEAIAAIRAGGSHSISAAKETKFKSGESAEMRLNGKAFLPGIVLLILSLLPTLFVPGLAGNYLKSFLPILLFGLFLLVIVAYVFIPWIIDIKEQSFIAGKQPALLTDIYGRSSGLIDKLTDKPSANNNRKKLWIILALLFIASVALLYYKAVVVRLLPFDDAMEFQVMVDMPYGTSLEQTQRVLNEFAHVLDKAPAISHFQTYAGMAPPLALSGLVRQDYQRESASRGAIHVNLVDSASRSESSHEVVRKIREEFQPVANRYGAVLRFAEVSTGLPSYAPIVAEIYGQDSAQKRQLTSRIRDYMSVTDSIVDTETSVGAASLRYIVQVDRQRASRSGFNQHEVASAISIALKGEDISFMHGTNTRHPVPIRIELPVKDRSTLDAVLNMKLRTPLGDMVSIRDLTTVVEAEREKIIDHKDLLPVVYVTADMAGRIDSPVYGMFSIAQSIIDDQEMGRIPHYLLGPPLDPYQLSIQWAGEWQITFQAFTGMLLAWVAGLVLIFLFLVAWLRSPLMALVAMIPVPLMLIGVLPGHLLFMQQFSLMSMLGMMVITGLIIRNTGLILMAVKHSISDGQSIGYALQDAVKVNSGFIVFTALVIILDAMFILGDDVLGGLAVSLIGGILVSTIVTLLVVPVVYYIIMKRQLPASVS